METIIFLAIVNLIGLLALGRGAVRSAAGYIRLLVGVAGAVAAAFAIAWATGETRSTGSVTSQLAALLLLIAMSCAATVAIATVRFLVAAVAAIVAIRHDRTASHFREEARASAPTEVWSDYPAWCREVASKHEALAEKASRWLYAE